MAKKKLGYVELHWECPNCATINPGPEKICLGCGAPQPADVAFFQPSQQQLITNEEKLKKAKAGADIHCAYCGTRNPAGAITCSQCKADLSQGSQRKAGQMVGAFKEGKVPLVACPSCGAENPETAKRCSQCGGSMAAKRAPQAQPKAAPKANAGVLAVIGLVFIGLCAAIYFLFLRTSDLTGTVENVEWQREVVLEAIVPVEYQDWWDEIPADAEIKECQSADRYESDQPSEGALEICGTPYSVDQGSGYAEVVQDCTYVVQDDFCSYAVYEWAPVETLTMTGTDYFPAWPNPALAQDERLGAGTESYMIYFDAGGKSYVYQTEDYDLFMQTQTDDTWNLEVNSIGGIQSISP